MMARPGNHLAWFTLLALTTYSLILIIGPQLAYSQLRASGWKQDPSNPNRFWFAGDDESFGAADLPELEQTFPAGPPDPTREELYLHAYDSSKCGQFAKFRDWQKQENAYNCWTPPFREFVLASAREQSRLTPDGYPRIVDGIPANEGEFPFYVRLTIYKQNGASLCGGTLIHENIVLTVAHCLAGGVNRIQVTLGTNLLDGSGGIQVEADKWCNHFEFDPKIDTQRDLAMIRLKHPVKYEVNRIVPACLYSHLRHQDRALCSAIGMGYVNGLERATRLMTLPVRRRCTSLDRWPFSSCYVADQKGTTCHGDSGAPVLCYDKCGEKKLTTRAFVVGAVSGGPYYNKCLAGQPLIHFMMSDFNWMHKSIEYLVAAIRNDYNLPYGYAQCTLTFRPPPTPRPSRKENSNWTE